MNSQDVMIRDLKKLSAKQSKRYGQDDISVTMTNAIIADVEAMPTVEPQRMRGEWIEDGYNHYKAVCSECGEPCATYVMGKPRDRFCKWCGADMRGDNNAAD